MTGVSFIANHELQALYKKVEELERELAEACRVIAWLRNGGDLKSQPPPEWKTPHDNS